MRKFSELRLGALARPLLGVRLGRLDQYSPQPCSVSRISGGLYSGDLPISMVTPSFNQAPFISRTIESVLGQDYPALQYIVQDGESSDGTQDILAGYTGRPAIEIRIEADKGQSDALNLGFASAEGEILGYLNSDDLLLPGALNLVGRYFSDHPSVDVIYGNRLLVDEHDLEIGRWILPDHDADVLKFVDYVPQESMFWRRQIWERVGASFDETLQFAIDWDLILRFMSEGAVFHHVPALFGAFRVHGAQKSQANFSSRGLMEMAALRSRYGGVDMGWARRSRLHLKFLQRHRWADAKFAAQVRAGVAGRLPGNTDG